MSNIASIDDRRNAAATFLSDIFRGATEGYIVVSLKRGPNDFEVHPFPITETATAAGKLVELAARGDTFVGRGLQGGRPAGRSRGTEADVVFVGGLFADIDTREGPHGDAPEKLPADATEALALIAEAGLPVPTLLIHTGGGCHAHWLYEAPAVLSTPEERKAEKAVSEAFQGQLRRTFQTHGYKLDGTADLSRICKAPGTLNHKTAPELLKPVVAMEGGPRYDRAELAKVANAARTEPARRAKRERAATARTDGFKPDLLEPILAGCAWMEHCQDDAATLSEPEWNAMLSITGRVEGGREISHELSKPHPGYRFEETETKIERAIDPKVTGPATCRRAENELGFAGCKRCPFRGAITSPINLAPLNEAVVKAARETVFNSATDQYIRPELGDRLSRHGISQVYGADIPSGPVAALQRSKIFRKVSGTVYMAGEDRLFVPPEEGRPGSLPLLNTWVKQGVLPAEGDTSLFLRHLGYLLPDHDQRNHVLDILAHLYQKPSEKITHGLIITGRQGMGKSILRRALVRLFGDDNIGKAQGSVMDDKWTASLIDKQILVIEEAALGAKWEIYNKFKELFSDENFDVQNKNMKSWVGKTPRGVLIFSNHTAPMAMEVNDRRFHVSGTGRVLPSTEHFDEIRHAIAEGPLMPAVAWMLAERDISHVRAGAPPPDTIDKRRAFAAALTPAAAVLHQLMEDGLAPFDRDVVTVEKVRRALLASTQFPSSEVLPNKKVEAAMREVGGVPLHEGGQIRVTAGRIRAWALRNGETWLDASLDDIKADYDRTADGGQNVVPFTSPTAKGRTLDEFLSSPQGRRAGEAVSGPVFGLKTAVSALPPTSA